MARHGQDDQAVSPVKTSHLVPGRTSEEDTDDLLLPRDTVLVTDGGGGG